MEITPLEFLPLGRAVMNPTTPHNILLSLILQTDLPSRIIMLCLCVMSVIGLTVFIVSYYKITAALRLARLLRSQAESSPSFAKLLEKKELFTHTPFRPLFAQFQAVENCFLDQSERIITVPIAENLQADVAAQTEQLVHDVLIQAERFLPMLKMSAELGPLMGLLGTVWGLIDAFGSIGQAKTVDMATIAPGIAQALLVTLTGLCIAIPALAFYGILTHTLKKLEHELYAATERSLVLATRSISEHTTALSSVEQLPASQAVSRNGTHSANQLSV